MHELVPNIRVLSNGIGFIQRDSTKNVEFVFKFTLKYNKMLRSMVFIKSHDLKIYF